MAAGDTAFGDHETLIAQVPHLMESTQKALDAGLHPMVVAAKWHGYYEYLHPFRDGNGRTGRLLSNFILLRAEHPLLIIRLEDRSAYISALKQIHSKGTDEHLVAFFFKTAITRMKEEMAQKRKALQTISVLLTKRVRAANETNRSRSSDRLQGW